MKLLYKIIIGFILLIILIIFFSKFILSKKVEKVNCDFIKIPNITVDKNYLLALNAVDQFLCSWLMRDQTKGTEFITDELKNKLSDNDLFAFFVGTSNPHHQGFEIIGNKHINSTKIRFYVWLYEYYTAQDVEPYKKNCPYYIDVVKFNEYIWKVDNLPIKIDF